jgi:hypothetical protein
LIDALALTRPVAFLTVALREEELRSFGETMRDLFVAGDIFFAVWDME